MRPVRVGWIALGAEDLAGLEQTLELAGLPAKVAECAEGEAGDVDCLVVDVDALDEGPRRLAELHAGVGSRNVPLFALTDATEPAVDDADHVFPRPRDASEWFGLVAALKFFWMSRTPSAPPDPGHSLRPRPRVGVDLMSLPIEPAEAYLLSVLDGKMSLDELAAVLGMPSRRLRKMLRRLADLGAVDWNPPHPSMPPTVQEGPAWSTFPSLPPPPPSVPAPPAPPAPDATPDAPSRFDETRRRAVDEAFAMVAAEADHYELLGVPRDAPKGTIRIAYFRLAKLFHSDTVYGEELGEYGRRMDRVFQAVTEAYDVLSRAKRRKGYDAYLAARDETAELDHDPDELGLGTPDLDEPEPEPTPEPTPTAATPAEAAKPKASGGKRRHALDALRRDLERRSGPRAAPATAPRVQGSSLRSLARAVGIIQSASGGDTRVQRLVADARTAENEGNLTGAATALSLASKWRPQDVALQREAKRVQDAAVKKKVEAYAERARYAESRGNWEEAALCWSKLVRASPKDLEAARHAAVAILKARANFAEGTRLARTLIEANPDDAEAHRLLGQLFLSAGKPASARRALQDALRIEPGDARTKDLLEQLD